MRNNVSRRARRHARFACAIESMESRVLLSTTIADWTFETSAPVSAGPITPEVGSGTGTVFHAGAASYNSVSGNGSSKSWSSNTWAVNDYYQFKVDTAGLGSIGLQYDQTSSNTGPKNFQVEYSTDGTTFTNYTGAFTQGTAASGITTVLANASPNPTWNGTTSSAIYTFAIDLTSISALNNQSTVYFRIADTSTVSANGGAVAVTGTDRIDNVIVVGTPVAVPIIGSVSVSPPSVIVNNGTTVSLTANNVTDTGASVTQVSFYVNSVSVANLVPGTASPSGSNWTLSGVSTAGLPIGTTTYIAVATDALTATSAPVSTTLAVLGTTQFAFSSPTFTANEASNTATITVNVSYPNGIPSTTATSVNYATSDGSHFALTNPEFDGAAVAGVDYTAVSGTLPFSAGQTTPDTFTVPLDNIKTFSTYSDGITTVTRVLNLTLSSPVGTNATLAFTNTTATLTISENTVTTTLGTDSPSGTTTASYAATGTAAGGSSNLFVPISVTSHGGFAGDQMPEIEFGAASTVFPNTYSAAAIDSVRLSLYNTAVTGTNFAGTPGAFDVYLLTNDGTVATSLTYSGTAPGTGPTVLGTPPEGGAIFVGTGTFTNNILGYNDYTFDNLSAPVQTALGSYFNSGGSPPMRFVIIPHLGSSIAADWQGNNVAQSTELPKLQLLVEKSNNVPEKFTISETGSNTPLGTINKGDGSADNDSLTFYVTRTGNAAASFDNDSVTIPYTLTGPDVDGVDYLLSGTNAPATSTGTTGTFTFAPGADITAPLNVTTILAPNTANISIDRTFTLKLGTPVPTGTLHVGILGTPSSEVVTIHDTRTANIVSTNSFNELATIEGSGPRMTTGTAPVVVTTTWQAEGSGSDTTPTAQFASYAIAEFNDKVGDPSDIFFPNDSNDIPGPSDAIGTINSITLNTVDESGQSFSAAGVVNVYLVSASATPSWPPPTTLKYITTAEPEGINGALGTQYLLGSFTINPAQSTSSYTSVSLTGASPAILAMLVSDLNNGQPFDIVLANEDAGGSFNVEGDPTSGSQTNAPEIGFNYIPASESVSTTPTWLAPNSTTTAFSIYGNSLAISGSAAQIVADPGGDDPIISDDGIKSDVLTIPASAGNAIHIGGVNLTGGATVVLSSVTGRTATNHRVLVVAGTGNFAIDSTSKLDLKDNDALFLGGSLSTVNASLTSGFNGSGAWWTGGGIISSVAALTPALKTLGVESNDNGSGVPLATTFDNQVSSDGDVLVKYTDVGDANLSGTLTAADYTAIDNGFNMALTGYANGNFNYDGAINGDDYTLIDNAYNSEAASSIANPLTQVAASQPAAPAKTSVFATGPAIPLSYLTGSVSSVSDGVFGDDKKSLADELLG